MSDSAFPPEWGTAYMVAPATILTGYPDTNGRMESVPGLQGTVATTRDRLAPEMFACRQSASERAYERAVDMQCFVAVGCLLDDGTWQITDVWGPSSTKPRA